MPLKAAVKNRLTSILPRSFYLDSPEVVASNLLGKLITRHLDGERLTGRIIEVEAYLGLSDLAAHTFIGKTPRNAVLFGPPGFLLCLFHLRDVLLPEFLLPARGGTRQRSHSCTGATRRTGDDGSTSWIFERCQTKAATSGPGRLCQALAITRAALNGIDVTLADSPLQVLDDGYRPASILATPRIGIKKAMDKPLRSVTRK